MIMTQDNIDVMNIRFKQMIGKFIFKTYSENIKKEIVCGMHTIAEKEFGLIVGGGTLNQTVDFTAAKHQTCCDLIIGDVIFNKETHDFTIDYHVADNNFKWHHYKITFEHSLKELKDC